MKSQIIRMVFIGMFSFCAVGVVMADAENEQLKQFADRIIAKMPSNWRVVEEKTGVIPYGHYDGLKYEGPGGLVIVLEGDRDVFLHWEDESGMWHQESLAKEALEIWIMPPEYHQSWKRFFIMKSPEPAERIYAGKKAKVYGYPTSRWASQEGRERFNEIVPSLSVATRWPDSPRHTGILSWSTWKEDIKEVLKNTKE
jgi:hypothetical protein